MEVCGLKMSSDIKLRVSDISCDHCKKFIEATIKALPGIINVDTSLKEGLVDVTFEPEKVKVSDIKEAIVDAGYDIER